MPVAIITIIILALSVFTILGTSYSDFLSKIDDLSLFLYSDKFFDDCMSMPGGLLDYCGCYLTLSFHYPWIGAIVYALCFGGLTLIAYKSLRLPNALAPIACIPPAMAMLTMLSLGYMIFTFKPIGFAFSNLLGYAVACALFWIYRTFSRAIIRVLIVLAIVIIGYPLFGFYALLGAGMCMVSEIGRWCTKEAGSTSMILALTILICTGVTIAVVPRIYYFLRNTYVLPSDIYIIGLPAFYPDELAFYWPTAIACAFMMLGAAISMIWKKENSFSKRTAGVSVLIAIGAMASVLIFSNKDANFELTVKLDRAIQANDWDRAIQLAQLNIEEPTRINVLLTDIALMRKGVAGEQMFKFQNGCAPYNTTRVATTMRDVGAVLINYHFGRLYNAYRWGMEYIVGYGMRAEHLKMMAKCAIMNGEYPLARKYLDTLMQSGVWKDWAQHYLAYLENPELIMDDSEMIAIMPLTEFADHLEGDGGKIETYLLPALSKLQGGNPQLMELSMQCALMQKDIEKFMPKLRNYIMSHEGERIPTHYQEAAILWSLLNKNRLYRRLNLDPTLETQFNNFIRLNQQYSDMDQEAAADQMRGLFGQTYWFYFFYNNDLKTY